ncbi:MAG: glycosyltransferase family 39 protein [Planctomycetes bacterium]|nr:glycosyltransferase family 39 protein [Planctomycetota bacterium]
MTNQVDIESLLDEIEQKQGKKQKVRRDGKGRREPKLVFAAEPWSFEHLAILVAVTVLAGVLRLYHIGEWSLWIDEVHTLRDAVLKTSEEFWRDSGTARYPVGFYILRWLEPFLPSASEGSYRLPFAFFGICSVPLLATVARRVVGAGPALLAALILAVSPWHLFWSQSVRFYSVELFFVLLAAACFFAGVESGRRRWLLGSLLFAGLAGLTHPSAALVVVGFVAFLVAMRFGPFEWPERLDSRAILTFALPLIVGGLVLLTSVVEAWTQFRSTKPEDETLFHLINTSVWFLRVPVIVAGVGGGYLLWQRSRRLALFLVSMIAVPSLGIAAASLMARASAQYLFFTLPFWCVLAAFAAFEIVSRVEFDRGRTFAVRAVVFGFLLLDPVAQDHLYYHYRHGDRPKWRIAANYIQEKSSPDDMFAATNEPSMEWYLNPVSPLQEVPNLDGENRKTIGLIADWTIQKLPELRDAAKKAGRRLWLITTPPTLAEADRQKKWEVWIRKHCRQALSLPNWLGPRDMTVQVWCYDPAAEAALESDADTGAKQSADDSSRDRGKRS